MRNSSTIATRIRKCREDRAWTQEQLAEIAGVAARTVQRTEEGKNVSFDTVQRLADALKMDVEKLRAFPTKKNDPKVEFLIRVTTGSDLCKVIGGTCASRFDNPEPRDKAEAELIGRFLQDAHDYGDLSNELEPAQQVEAAHGMTTLIRELEDSGLWVFVGRRQETIRIPTAERGYTKMPWPVAIVIVGRDDDPTILRVGETKEQLPTVVLE